MSKGDPSLDRFRNVKPQPTASDQIYRSVSRRRRTIAIAVGVTLLIHLIVLGYVLAPNKVDMPVVVNYIDMGVLPPPPPLAGDAGPPPELAGRIAELAKQREAASAPAEETPQPK
jgi:hypothetical protein